MKHVVKELQMKLLPYFTDMCKLTGFGESGVYNHLNVIHRHCLTFVNDSRRRCPGGTQRVTNRVTTNYGNLLIENNLRCHLSMHN